MNEFYEQAYEQLEEDKFIQEFITRMERERDLAEPTKRMWRNVYMTVEEIDQLLLHLRNYYQ